MKNKYDFLITDKIPFLYFEKAKIVMDDGFLIALNGKKDKETIPIANVGMLILGFGTSISQEAALKCAEYNCMLCFSRGGFNLHTSLQEQRFKNPEKIFNQINLSLNHKLEIAKEFFKLRLLIDLNDNKYEEQVNNIKTIEELLGYEANYYKKKYYSFAEKYSIENFKRNKEFELRKYKKNEDINSVPIIDQINGRLNITNNVLYSYCSMLSLSLSLEPSIGFVHGKTRRGGLAFDLSDLLKVKTTLPLSFDLKQYEHKDLILYMRNKMSENNFQFINLLVEICQKIGNGEVFDANQIYNKIFVKNKYNEKE